MKRIYNFSAGPSMLPEDALREAAAEMLDYQGTGMSVMEMSHRSKPYEQIHGDAEALLRELLGIPENYSVLFLQGGASTQFAMVPMNLMTKNKKADFAETGHWAQRAIDEAKKFGEVRVICSSKDKNFSYIPSAHPFNADADYVHITLNNTIYGTRYVASKIPATGAIPLVTDASSNILSEALDVSKFGLIYAGAQKNLGPAGVTVVIVRKDLVVEPPASVPTMLGYKIHDKNKSLYNTPPCYSIYMVMKVLQWVKKRGGLKAMQKTNEDKAKLLYDYLDASAIFKGTVAKEDRSLMNIPFVLPNDDLNNEFLAKAEAAGMENLKGHRTVGGMRASIYNAMPVEGVKALVALMDKFEKEHK